MISCSDLRTGMTILHENNIYSVLEYQHVKSIDLTVNSSEKFEPAHIEKVSMQYLYDSGTFYVFMNNSTYEQIEIPVDKLENEKNFLFEGLEVKIVMYESEVIGIELPDKVVLNIVECEPAVKGDTAQNASKNATLQTGLVIQVPLFVENGENVIVSTLDGKYVSRAK